MNGCMCDVPCQSGTKTTLTTWFPWIMVPLEHGSPGSWFPWIMVPLDHGSPGSWFPRNMVPLEHATGAIRGVM